jgi:hypothetical protein
MIQAKPYSLMKKRIGKHLYTAWQWTWGLPQTLSGAGLYLKHRKDPHFDYNGARVTAWSRNRGVSLGKFIFVPEKKGWGNIQTPESDSAAEKNSKKKAGEDSVSRYLLEHEYGHTIQCLLLGPLYWIVVALPSAIWCNFFADYRKKNNVSYYKLYCESWANKWGVKWSGLKQFGIK